MSSYASQDEFQKRLGERLWSASYDNRAAYQQDVVDLAAASAEIDGSVSVRYVLPVTGENTLALLKDWTLTLAEERAYARTAGSEFPEKVKSRVAQVRSSLELLREGKFRLPDAVEVGSGSGGPSIALVQSDEPIFTRDRMRRF